MSAERSVAGGSWFLLEGGRSEPAFNMALDQVLLERVAQLGRPVLRFYGWSERAATFGYFQRYDDVAALTSLRPLIRRPTGGGLVPHEADWTYSVVIPPGCAWYNLKAVASYHLIHSWIGAAFRCLAIETDLSADAVSEGPGECFAGAERHDLLWGRTKIAGAAQRRNRDGLLIQGSIQWRGGGLERTAWEAAMKRHGEESLGIRWERLIETPWLEERAVELARALFGTEDYNRRR